MKNKTISYRLDIHPLFIDILGMTQYYTIETVDNDKINSNIENISLNALNILCVYYKKIISLSKKNIFYTGYHKFHSKLRIKIREKNNMVINTLDKPYEIFTKNNDIPININYINTIVDGINNIFSDINIKNILEQIIYNDTMNKTDYYYKYIFNNMIYSTFVQAILSYKLCKINNIEYIFNLYKDNYHNTNNLINKNFIKQYNYVKHNFKKTYFNIISLIQNSAYVGLSEPIVPKETDITYTKTTQNFYISYYNNFYFIDFLKQIYNIKINDIMIFGIYDVLNDNDIQEQRAILNIDTFLNTNNKMTYSDGKKYYYISMLKTINDLELNNKYKFNEINFNLNTKYKESTVPLSNVYNDYKDIYDIYQNTIKLFINSILSNSLSVT